MGRQRLIVGGTIALVALLLVLPACQGPAGPAGPPGPNNGTLSGTVTNSLTKAPLAGATVTLDPPVKPAVTTSASGGYSFDLPIGAYTLSFKLQNFGTVTQAASVAAGQTTTKDAALKPDKAVVVNAGQDQTAAAGATVTLRATVQTFDGSSATGYKWAQTSGVPISITNPTADTITVTLGDAKRYQSTLLEGLVRLERFTVQPINPHALEAAEATNFTVTVTTNTGSYTDSVIVRVNLPYVVNGGLANVPVGEPVLLNGKTQAAYQWVLTGPSGTKSSLGDARTRNPSFTPDVAGKYSLSEKTSGATIDVYAGTWSGGITGLDAKGRPLSAGCTVCHDGKAAPDKFTAWKDSGHAEIFTQNLNSSATYGESCFTCHTVGFDKAVANGGFDDAADYGSFVSTLLGKPSPTTWSRMLIQSPKAAQLANIQCENCHGPNNSPLHANKQLDAARISLSADVCATCHGEPPRHGRFQQWEESGHGNYELAIEEGAASSSCARCHGAQGFLIWLKQGDLTKQIQGAKGNATAAELAAMGITTDTVQPQTCVVCHDPHQQGTTSGEPNTATVRIEGNTAMLPAGFKATEVGKGALCITCHNTRNALHNDANPPTSYGGPHQAAQGDVLMGENAYFVGEGLRSSHSYLKDTCVTCHMEESPPPAEFSYNLSGTNHSFEASTTICSSCHSATLSAKAFEKGVEAKVEKLAAKMGEYFLKKMPAKITLRDYNTPHDFGGKSYALTSDYLVVSKDNIAAVEWAYIVRQQGFIIKFKSPLTFTYRPTGETPHSVSLSAVAVRLGEITTDGTTVLIPFTDALVKAGWNYLMITYDASEGIHNPAFVNAVLDASIAALK